MTDYQKLFPESFNKKTENTIRKAGVLQLRNDGKLPLHASKVGGVGYFPEHLTYPIGVSGKPLHFLAQLNFADLPAIPNFPTEGILAFYIDMDDDLYGMDLDDYKNKAGYRTYYFEDITQPARTRETLEALPQPEYEIVESEYAIECSVEAIPLLQDNYEFKIEHGEDHYSFLENLFGDEIDDKADELYDYLTKQMGEGLMGEGLIGGYPLFTQEDPRFYHEHLQQDILLFQLESVFGEDVEVMWGDAGIANFFIHPTDLKNRNFNNVWFNWDCH